MAWSTASARKGRTTIVSCFIILPLGGSSLRGPPHDVAGLEDSARPTVLNPAPGDRQGLAADVTAFLAGQEQHGVGDVGRLAQSAGWNLLDILRQHFRLEPFEHRRLNHAWSNCVDGDAALCQLL